MAIFENRERFREIEFANRQSIWQLMGNLWTFIQPISEYFGKKSDGLPKEKIKAEFESKSRKKQRQ